MSRAHPRSLKFPPPRSKFIAGFSGDFVNAYGYATFFHATAWLGAPVLLLVWLSLWLRRGIQHLLEEADSHGVVS